MTRTGSRKGTWYTRARIRLGQARSKKCSGGHDDDDGLDAALSEVKEAWVLQTARSVSRLGGNLQSELLHDSVLVNYLIGWFDAPMTTAAGASYADTCVLYLRRLITTEVS